MIIFSLPYKRSVAIENQKKKEQKRKNKNVKFKFFNFISIKFNKIKNN